MGPVFFEQLQSVTSSELMYFVENVGACAGCCFDPLCSPPGVSPCRSADPPTSPGSEGAWSRGSPSSGTPPSQLLWKWVFRQGYHFLSQILNVDTDWPQDAQQSQPTMPWAALTLWSQIKHKVLFTAAAVVTISHYRMMVKTKMEFNPWSQWCHKAQ